MNRVITGYNTDIKHSDRVFHVQTEDKGVDNPVIESLIYTGGKIIASRQYQYGWLLREGYSEKAVQELVDIQHRKMLRDIRGGKYDPEGPPRFGSGIVTDRSFDEVVLEFIDRTVGSEGIELVVAEPESIRAGELLVIDLAVLGDALGRPVSGALVQIRARTSERSVTLFEGWTDDDGKMKAGFELPREFTGANLEVEASSTRGEDIVRWPIA